MAALGELLVLAIYALLAFIAIFCIVMTFIRKAKVHRFLYFLGVVTSISLYFLFWTNNKGNHRAAELDNVGTYYLTNYPNCDSCEIILNENNFFEVRKGTKVFETGDWHYESGGDYWIVNLNKNEDQLGTGRFVYKKYNKKYTSVKK